MLRVVGLVAAVGCAASAENEQNTASADAFTATWQNIVELSYTGPSYVDTRAFPNAVLRPVRGRYLRLSVPASCGVVQIYALTLQGRTAATGQVIPLAANVVATSSSSGQNRWTYELQGGGGATVREIGLFGHFAEFGACRVVFEQSDVLGIDPDPSTDNSCPAPGYINCLPSPGITNPNCAPTRRRWVEDNCPAVSYLD